MYRGARSDWVSRASCWFSGLTHSNRGLARWIRTKHATITPPDATIDSSTNSARTAPRREQKPHTSRRHVAPSAGPPTPTAIQREAARGIMPHGSRTQRAANAVLELAEVLGTNAKWQVSQTTTNNRRIRNNGTGKYACPCLPHARPSQILIFVTFWSSLSGPSHVVDIHFACIYR